MSNKFDDESPIKENLEPLIHILKTDNNWNKRFGAASKLFRLGQEKAVDPLIHTLQNDENKEMRRFACDLLGKLGDTRATWALIAALRQALEKKDKLITFHASEALLSLKRDGDLQDILISTISDSEEFFSMRIMAIEMLGKIADIKSIEGLIALIKNPDTEGKIRGKAIEELIYTGNLAGLQLILEQLEVTKRKDFQKIVIKALGKTPFKNKTIVFRISEILLSISEQEEKRKAKDSDLIFYSSEAIKNLAKNIGYDFPDFMDELIKIRDKQKK